jgi:hypothetical protein
MLFAVSFQKIDPGLDAIIIGAEVMCDGATQMAPVSLMWMVRWRRRVRGVGAKIYGADPW